MASTPLFHIITFFMILLVSLTLSQQKRPLSYPPLPSSNDRDQFSRLDTAVTRCMASLVNMGECYAELFRAYTTLGQDGLNIGPVCCKATHDMGSKCWCKLFPYNPFFPPMVQNYCARFDQIGSYAELAPVIQ